MEFCDWLALSGCRHISSVHIDVIPLALCRPEAHKAFSLQGPIVNHFVQ